MIQTGVWSQILLLWSPICTACFACFACSTKGSIFQVFFGGFDVFDVSRSARQNPQILCNVCTQAVHCSQIHLWRSRVGFNQGTASLDATAATRWSFAAVKKHFRKQQDPKLSWVTNPYQMWQDHKQSESYQVQEIGGLIQRIWIVTHELFF